jgi:ribonuclease HI
MPVRRSESRTHRIERRSHRFGEVIRGAPMPWIPMNLRDTRVLARCDGDGRPKADGGRVEIRYKPSDGRAYHAAARNLAPIAGAEILPDEHCAPAEAAAPKAKTAKKKTGAKSPAREPTHPDGALIVYADGACSGNPGPAGLGVVIVDGKERRELSEYLGVGTNNIAELTAILRAAEALTGRNDPIRVFTDSRYSIGVLTQGWKAKKNPELVAKVREALRRLPDVELHYVPGHAGVALNEVADALAREAVDRRASLPWLHKKL